MGKQTENKKKLGGPLILPFYSSPSRIKYDVFVTDLQKSNAELKEVTQAEAQRALRQYFVNFFGKESFGVARKTGESCADIDKDRAAWAKLSEEGQQYRRRRRG